MPTPPLPPGYQLDQGQTALPPLPNGYRLDTGLPTYEQAAKEAQDYVGRGAAMLGGSEGIAEVGKEAVTLGKLAEPYVNSFLNLPKVKPVADLVEKEIMKVPGADALKSGWGLLKTYLSKDEAPPTYPGAPLPEHPGTFPGAPLPATPAPEVLNPSLVSESRTTPGMHSPERVQPTPVQPRATSAPIPSRQGLALSGDVYPGAPLPEAPAKEVLQAKSLTEGGKPTPPSPASALGDIPVPKTNRLAEPIDTSRKAVSQAVDQSLNVQPLKPDVPLKAQITAEPKGSTAVESHSYDAGAKELHVTPKSNPNVTYVYGDASPDQAAAFESGSKGQAWSQLRQSGSPLVAKIVDGKRVPVKPMNRLASSGDLTDVLQQSVQQVKKNRLAASAAAD